MRIKRLLCMLLVLIMTASFFGCTDDGNQRYDNVDSEFFEETFQDTEPIVRVETVPVVEDGSIIYSENGIEITYVKTKGTKYFEYEVINNSDRDIQFSFDAVAVNKCMVPDLMALGVVTAGNKSIQKYDLSGTEAYGIDDVETIDIYVVLYDRETYSTIDKELIHLDLTPVAGFTYSHKLEQFYDDEFFAAYVEKEGDKYKDFEVLYYNKSDVVISAALTEVAVNDIMVLYNLKASYVLPGCYAYTGAPDGATTIWSAVDSELKSMEPINKIEGKIALWADIFDMGYMKTENILICTNE